MMEIKKNLRSIIKVLYNPIVKPIKGVVTKKRLEKKRREFEKYLESDDYVINSMED